MEHLESVKALYEMNVDLDDEQTFGVHGTSIEAIKYLAIHGKMPFTGKLGINFHFCPKTGVAYLNGPYAEAAGYAGISAFRNLLLAKLKAASTSPERAFIDDIFTASEEGFEFNGRLVTRIKKCLGLRFDHQFYRYIDSLRTERKGVIIGVRKKISELGLFEGLDEDFVVRVPGGLPIDYISGLDALGQFELDEILHNNFANVELLY